MTPHIVISYSQFKKKLFSDFWEFFPRKSTIFEQKVKIFPLCSKIRLIWYFSKNLKEKSDALVGRIGLQRNLLKNTQGLSFLSRNSYRRYRWDVKYQNSEYLFLFLDPKIVTKSAVRFVLRWNFLNKTQV
jgi:hypothetical protein